MSVQVPPESGSYFYHSENFGAVHSIFLSPYVDYTPGSDQWTWLWQDLASVRALLLLAHELPAPSALVLIAP